MRKFFLLLVMFSVALGGCGDIEWFPEQGVAEFSFEPQTGVAPGETATSNTITVTTPNASENISVSGGEYSIGGGDFTASAGTVKSGDQVTVRHRASFQAGGVVETRVQIGDKSGTFRSTAGGVTFDPPILLNAPPATERTSSEETVIIAGTSAPISITGGSYSLDKGPFETAAGTVNAGQTVRVRHTTAAAGSTGVAATKITELNIGGMKSTFTTSITGVATVRVQLSGTTGTEVLAQVPSLVTGEFNLWVREAPGNTTVALSPDEEPWDTPPKLVTLAAGQPIFIRENIFPSSAIISIDDDQTPVQRIEVTSTAR